MPEPPCDWLIVTFCPFSASQNFANAAFNSALDYELAVLKPLAAPLLNQIKPWDEEYIEARRLSGFLHNFSSLAPDVVPGDSILREYIGGSQLTY